MIGSRRSHGAKGTVDEQVRLRRVWIVFGSAVVGGLLIFTTLGGPSVQQSAPAESVDEPAAVTTTPSAPPSARSTASGQRPSRSPEPRIIRDQVSGPVLAESDPVSVAIPRIGARSRLVSLALGAGGELEVPQDPARAGWFTGAATPGALGPAVIAGHVTWNGAPAVFYRLDTVRPGDQVTVGRRDGKAAVFTVSRVARFPKSRFPTKAVYGPVGHAGLRLITCGGTYDTSRHRYLDNVVVFARLSAVQDSRE
jgi:hypothetical protein